LGHNQEQLLDKLRGQTTGLPSGTVNNTNETYDRFETSANGADGDSGGPFYHMNSRDYLDIVGLTFAATLDNEKTKGHSIEWIINQFNLTL
jgi:hypothetical protein